MMVRKVTAEQALRLCDHHGCPSRAVYSLPVRHYDDALVCAAHFEQDEPDLAAEMRLEARMIAEDDASS